MWYVKCFCEIKIQEHINLLELCTQGTWILDTAKEYFLCTTQYVIFHILNNGIDLLGQNSEEESVYHIQINV